jgi:hypothetical protein
MGAKRTKQNTVNLMLRLPANLHADLVRLASAQMPPVSLNHCIVTQLMAAVLRDKVEQLSPEELRRFVEYGRRTLAAAEREAAGGMPSNIPLSPTQEAKSCPSSVELPPIVNLPSYKLDKRSGPRKKKGAA